MSTENKNNYYEILGVSESATQHDITLAYEKAKRTYSQNNKALYSVFSESEVQALKAMVEEAFHVLSHQDYRTLFEKRLNSKSYSSSDLSLNALKKAKDEMFDENPIIENTLEKAKSISINEKPTGLHHQLYQPPFSTNPEVEAEIQNCEEWSGDFLKKIREYKKYSIELLHEKTKVNPWYLKALENMQPDQLPAPVFVRGYVVQMAKTLGLDERKVADSYMRLFKNKIEKPDSK